MLGDSGLKVKLIKTLCTLVDAGTSGDVTENKVSLSLSHLRIQINALVLEFRLTRRRGCNLCLRVKFVLYQKLIII